MKIRLKDNTIVEFDKRPTNAVLAVLEGVSDAKAEERRINQLGGKIQTESKLLSELKETRKQVVEAVKDIKIDELKINNPEDISLDLDPLREDISNLEDAILSIPEAQPTDLSKVEKLITDIKTDKKVLNRLDKLVQKDIDMTPVLALGKKLEELKKAVQDLKKEEKDYTEILMAIGEALPSGFDEKSFFRKLRKELKDNLSVSVVTTTGGTGGGGNLDDGGNVVSSPLKQSQRFEFSGGNLIYQGVAAPGAAEGGAVWRITKMTYDGSNNITKQEWADGNTNYDNVWTDRAILSYS